MKFGNSFTIYNSNGLTRKMLSLLSLLLFFSSIASAITVNSLIDLLPYLNDDNVEVTLAPGIYNVSGADYNAGTFGNPILPFTGNNSTYDFTGVTILFSTDLLTTINASVEQIRIYGNNNVLKNLTMVDNGANVRPRNGGVNIVMDGMNNRVEGFDMTVKGSYPYAYGDAFGKGATVVINHYKHSAVLVRGTSNHLLNCNITHRAYGHAIFMQAAEYPLIEGCTVEGEMRSTDDMLAETSGPAFDVDFMTVWGYRLPPGFMMSLQEAGIRAYTDGITTINGVEIARKTSDPTVRNCVIKNVRAGVTLTHAKGTETIEGSTCLGCERGFAIGTGSIINCSADAIYGPALALDETASSSTTADVTLLSSDEAYYNGSGQVVSLTGSGYNITIRGDGSYPKQDMPIEISGIYKDIRNYNITTLKSTSDVKIHNYSGYPLLLGSKSSNTTGESGGMITDLGTNNKVVFSAVSLLKIEAENYTNMSGAETVVTADEDGGHNISSIDAGDWMEYEITIPASGTYSLDYRVSGTSPGDFKVKLNGESIDELGFEPTGGDQVWKTVRSSSPVYLSEGLDTIRIVSNTAGWNLNWIKLLTECYDTSIIPYIKSTNSSGTVLSYKQTAKAEINPGLTVILDPEPKIGGTWSWSGPNSYSLNSRELTLSDIELNDGGDYVATFTNDCGQQSVQTFTISVSESIHLEAENYDQMNGVLKETTTDIGGGENIHELSNGDWIEFEIDIPFTADFFIDYRVASETIGGSFTLTSEGKTIDNISFDSTGGSQIWSTVNSVSLIRLNAGKQTIRITSKTDEWKLNWLELNLLQIVSPCDLPYTPDDITIRNDNFSWTSGAIDINCVPNVSIFATLRSSTEMDDSEYLNIYYKLDAGELIPISENVGEIENKLVYADELSGKTVEIIIKGFTNSTAKKYGISNILMQYGSNVESIKLEAEKYNGIISGTNIVVENCVDEGGGSQLGYLSPGDWSMHKNIDLTGVTRIEARIASKGASGTIKVRLGSSTGTLIGTIPVTKTNGWTLYETFGADIEATSGIQDVYFVYSAGFNVNWFQFYESLIPVETDLNVPMEDAGKINMYPNPVNYILHFDIAKSSIVEIYNSVGCMVFRNVMSGNDNTVNMNHLRSGLYVVRVINRNNIKTEKIIKQ